MTDSSTLATKSASICITERSDQRGLFMSEVHLQLYAVSVLDDGFHDGILDVSRVVE